MKIEDKLFRKVKKLSILIAKLSAYKDEEGDWWGKDTNIGNLPFEIQKELAKFADWIRSYDHKN